MASTENSDEELAIQAEILVVEQELKSTEAQIQNLITKQSDLQSKRSLLKKQLKASIERKKSSVDLKSETFEWSEKLRLVAEKSFQITTFRPLQLETMNATLKGFDCIVILPTGAGKSLCYQLPALLSTGVTLVISPLVSLMEDQVMALERLDITASMLNADSSKEKQNSVYSDIGKNPCKLKLLYVTPEKLAKSKRFMNKLEACYKSGSLSRIAIDEVHCCSQWGHDFRPDYKFLGVLKRQFPKTPLLGLTATASRYVLSDVQKILNIPNCEVYRGSFNRPNLRYSVVLKPASHDECMQDMAKLIKEKYNAQSGIVYCFSRKDTAIVADDLTKLGVRSSCYHADLPANVRSRVHSLWMSNKVQVIVATIAFGMGIDKPDVRFVIHHSMSKSVENYYQESGRAGRDAKSADCILYYRQSDVYRQSCMVFTESTGLEKLYNMLEYCLDTSTCRRRLLARHFSETWGNNSCDEQCDFCSGTIHQSIQLRGRNVAPDIQRVYEVLDKASAADTRLTGQKVLDGITGKGAAKARASTQSNLTKEQCECLLGWMLVDGLIKEDFHFTPYSTISYLVSASRAPKLSFQVSDEDNNIPDTSTQLKRKTSDKAKEKSKKSKNSDIIVLD